MVKFSPIALNFGHDFVLLVHFLGHPVVMTMLIIIVMIITITDVSVADDEVASSRARASLPTGSASLRPG